MDDGRYRALLIGNSTFPNDTHNLPSLEGPVNDVARLRDALTNPEFGLFESTAVRLVPERTTQEILIELERFFAMAKRDECLLLYYSGHGVLNRKDELHLGARDSRTDLMASTTVSASAINSMIESSSAQTTIIVLDCCYSGAFKGASLPNSLRGTGRYLLTSCRSGELANDADQLNSTSVFTEHVVQGLLNAAPDTDGDGYVDLDDVYSYVHERLLTEGRQIPQRHFAGGGDVPIARRPVVAQEVPAAPPPPEVTPVLELSESTIELVDVGPAEKLPPEYVQVYNRGGGSLDWTAETTADWVRVESGTRFFTVHLQPRPGMNRATVIVHDKVTNEIRTVRVRVSVLTDDPRSGSVPAVPPAEPAPPASAIPSAEPAPPASAIPGFGGLPPAPPASATPGFGGPPTAQPVPAEPALPVAVEPATLVPPQSAMPIPVEPGLAAAPESVDTTREAPAQSSDDAPPPPAEDDVVTPPEPPRGRKGPSRRLLVLAMVGLLMVGGGVVAALALSGDGDEDTPVVTAAPVPPPTLPFGKVEVPATRVWTDTGFDLKPGDIVAIEATGEMQAGPTVGKNGPEGIPERPDLYEWNVIKDKNHAALIGRAGDKQTFLVGNSITFRVVAPGHLWLGINDWGGNGEGPENNTGGFLATITVTGESTDPVSGSSGYEPGSGQQSTPSSSAQAGTPTSSPYSTASPADARKSLPTTPITSPYVP